MAKFQLIKARRRGEEIARDFGFSTFPIDPFKVATDEDIVVSPKPPDRKGVSGGIIFSDSGTGIFYATNIKSEGFHRFTVAHELGHYFLEGHPEEITKVAPIHVSYAGFREGDNWIELEADHFASGLLMPTDLVKQSLRRSTIGFAGIEDLAEVAKCSLTAAAIRAAECAPHPMAVVVSRGDTVCYCFMSEGFKALKPRHFPRKGSRLPLSATERFNLREENVVLGLRETHECSLFDWFEGSPQVRLDEEIVGLGGFEHTLTVFSSDHLDEDPDEIEDEDTNLVESYTPRFAYGR